MFWQLILRIFVLSTLSTSVLVLCRKDFQFETFGHCLKQNEKPSLVKCAGEQVLVTLQQFNNIENFTIAQGLVVSRDDSAMGRNIPTSLFEDSDPSDIRLNKNN